MKAITGVNYAGLHCSLIHAATGSAIRTGEYINSLKIVGGSPPHKISSSGKVAIKCDDGTREFYPSVINCKWVVN
jgi:hypothetical protein